MFDFLKHLPQSLYGFSHTHHTNLLQKSTKAAQKETSSSSLILQLHQFFATFLALSKMNEFLNAIKWTRLSTFVSSIFFLPLLIFSWPRANTKNENFKWLLEFCDDKSKRWYYQNNDSLHLKCFGILFTIIHLVLKRTPLIQNYYLLKIFEFIDKHMLQLILMITIGTYVGFFFAGQSVMAIAGGLTLGFGILERAKIIPLPVKNLVQRLGLPLAIFSGFFLGSALEIFFSVMMLPIAYGYYVKNNTFFGLSKLYPTEKSTEDFKRSKNRLSSQLGLELSNLLRPNLEEDGEGIEKNAELSIPVTITGDGSCAMYPVAVTLCAYILDNQFPTTTAFTEFLQKFSDFHPNFKPVTKQNFKAWVENYAPTRRDMELLVGPVLRYWYESTTEGLNKEEGLQKLVTNRSLHLGDEAIEWVCQQLGFNLKFTTEGFSYDTLEGNPGPTVHPCHEDEHFDCRLSSSLAKYVQDDKESLILIRKDQNVDNAWNYHYKPLPCLNVSEKEISTNAVERTINFRKK